MEEADHPLIELVRLGVVEISHQVGDGLHLVRYEETCHSHLEVLESSLSGECGSEKV